MAKFTVIIFAIIVVFLGGCGDGSQENTAERVVAFAAGGRVKSLDPALADDLPSRNMVGAIYDTLVEYDYTARPYKLIPAMLEAMPSLDSAGRIYTFTLRDDLYFAKDRCFGDKKRKITSDDVIYSFKRLADGNLHSPCYWMIRGKIEGLNEFNRRSLAGECDYYDSDVAGLERVDNRTFKIHLTKRDLRFLSILALPNLGIVPREAVEFYKEKFATNPVGSGPFFLYNWVRDCRLDLRRNPDFRTSYFREATSKEDQTRTLPLSDRLLCYQIRQPFTAWLLFLQGEIDASVLDKDNLDLVAGSDELSPLLKERGVELMTAPEFEIRYIGFNFRDPVMQNAKLRQAISLAFNLKSRIIHANNLLKRVEGPIPPGVSGYDASIVNPYLANDLSKAKQLLAQAGYPDGIDPATGEALVITFDQGNTTSAQRQIGELLAHDLAKIGIKVEIILNSAPRFVERLRQGETQMFRYSWVGDYPDAENFLQLFYSGNVGGCNRAAFSLLEYDKCYEEVANLQDSPRRDQLYRKMTELVIAHTPWIFEGMPIAYQLKYDWLENYYAHDFAFARWKYLSVRADERDARRKKFTPLNFSEF